jgi:hypothetical protein
MGNLKSNMTKEEWSDLQKEVNSSHSDQVIDIMNKEIIIGKLHKAEYNQWIITYLEGAGISTIPLHPTDVEFIDRASEVFDNMEARIAVNPIIKFTIVEQQKLTGISKYGKLI